MPDPSGQRGPKGDDAVGEQRVVADAEHELVREVAEAVDDWRGAEQQDATAQQPRCDMVVPAGMRIPEVVTLVDDDEPGRGGGKASSARLLVGADLDRHANRLGQARPLVRQGGGDEACARAAQCGGHRERDVALAAADGIGEQRAAEPLERSQHAPKASHLARQQPGRGGPRAFRRQRSPRESRGPPPSQTRVARTPSRFAADP